MSGSNIALRREQIFEEIRRPVLKKEICRNLTDLFYSSSCDVSETLMVKSARKKILSYRKSRKDLSSVQQLFYSLSSIFCFVKMARKK